MARSPDPYRDQHRRQDARERRRRVNVGAGLLAVVVAYIGAIGGINKFQPPPPSRAQANVFLQNYYRDVTTGQIDSTGHRCCWNRLTQQFKDNFKDLKNSDEKDYDEYWNTIQSVDVSGVQGAEGSDFTARLDYHKRKSNKAIPESVQFTLACPWWTTFTVVGCDSDNMLIDDTRVIG